MLTLGLYLLATILTALSFSPLWFFVFRFLTGMGIGGEYSAINSAIDELIPAKSRGHADISINGSYWGGAIGGSLLAVLALNTSIFPINLGWRLCFALGAVLGLRCPDRAAQRAREPALAVHPRPRAGGGEGRQRNRRRGARAVRRQSCASPRRASRCASARTIPLPLIVRSVVTLYPRRTILGLALFVGQAFLYNAAAVQPRRHAQNLLRRGERQHALLHRDLRRGQPARPADARAPVRHSRAQADDRRHLPAVRRLCWSSRPSCSRAASSPRRAS